jgi:hypothetical protein
MAHEALHDTRRELLKEEAYAEHYHHHVLCLRARIERLEMRVEMGEPNLPTPPRLDYPPLGDGL